MHTCHSFKKKKGKEVGDGWGRTSQKATEETDHLVFLWPSPAENSCLPCPANWPRRGCSPAGCSCLGRAKLTLAWNVRRSNPPGQTHLPDCLSQVHSPTLICIKNLSLFINSTNGSNSYSQLQLGRGEKLCDLHSVRYLEIHKVLNLMRPWKVFSVLTLRTFHQNNLKLSLNAHALWAYLFQIARNAFASSLWTRYLLTSYMCHHISSWPNKLKRLFKIKRGNYLSKQQSICSFLL